MSERHMLRIVVPVAVLLASLAYVGGFGGTEMARSVAAPAAIISEMQVTNVRDTSFTVSWITDTPTAGCVNYGPTTALGDTACDSRGESHTDDIHYVILENLSPETTYYFDVVSGSVVDDNEGTHHIQSTGPTLDLPAPDTIYGQVFKADGETPAEGAIVYVTVKDEDGQGNLGESAPLSALVNADGWWSANLGNVRAADLSAYFQYSDSGDMTEQKVQGAADGTASQSVDTCCDTPSPSMVLMVVPPAPTDTPTPSDTPEPTVYISPPSLEIGVGFTETSYVRIDDVIGLYGYEVHLTFDPAIVQIESDIQPGDIFAGKGNREYQKVISNTLGTVDYAVSLEAEPEGVAGNGTLLGLDFQCVAEGTSTISLTTDTRLSDIAGERIERTLQNGSITCIGVGQIEGSVRLQGREDHSGATVTVDTTWSAVTDATGVYSVTNVLPGTYPVTITMPDYLYAIRNAVSVEPGRTTMLPAVKLLGGDVNDDDCINIQDAVLVSRDFGKTVPPADPRADINSDGRINIQDAVLVARNFGSCAPGPWPDAQASGSGPQTAPGRGQSSARVEKVFPEAPLRATLSISPTEQQLAVGDTGAVGVRVDDVTGLYGYEVHLTFDPQKVRIVGGVQLGDIFQGKSAQEFQNIVDNINGRVDYAVALQAEPAGVSGSGSLIRVEFAGVADGTSDILLTSDTLLSDIDARLISRMLQNGSVTVAGCTSLTYDFDCDCNLDVKEIMEVTTRWGTSQSDPDPDGDPDTPNYNVLYDLDGNGNIGSVDATLVTTRWRERCSDQ